MTTFNGGPFDDIIVGTNYADVIYGNGGNDQIDGKIGDDYISGGDGLDIIFGDTGNDIIYGDAGNDKLDGGIGNDRLEGGDGDDIIIGGFGDDRLYGNAGDDIFVLNGGANWDSYDGGTGNNKIVISSVGSTFLWTALQITSITNISRIQNSDVKDAHIYGNGFLDLSAIELFDMDEFRGTSGNDTLIGNKIYNTATGLWSGMTMVGDAGNDYLIGSTEGDFLQGGLGDDRLSGLAGDDRLQGGAGIDTFVFKSNGGADRVLDFEDGFDLIDLTGTMVSDFSGVTVSADTDGTLLSFDGTTVLLAGISSTSIDSGDFLFA